MSIKTYLKEHIVVFDGAMGTYFAEKHLHHGTVPCELFNLSHPEWIQQIHEEYLAAGAAAIKTNTYAANGQMAGAGKEKVEQIIRAAWQIGENALKKVTGEHFLFADIGPVSAGDNEDVFGQYRKIVDIFLECGANCFLFETMESSEGLEQIASYIKERVEDGFIIVSFAATPEGYTRSGFLAKRLFWEMQQVKEIDAVGFNCISGPKHLLEMVKTLPQDPIKKYLTIMPNAGYPAMLGNRIYYGQNHEYFGEALTKLTGYGANIVGGCCGTTPADIAGTAARLEAQSVKPRVINGKIEETGRRQTEAAADREPDHGKGDQAFLANPKNDFAEKLKRGKKVIVVELDPPVEPDIAFFMEGAARYKRAGVDAIDIADCPIAKARIDSSILACKVTRELGLTTIPHMTCRDRNMNATKALLLGLNVEGVNNVLTVTGDPVPTAMRDQIKTLFSYNSAVLARHIRTLNEEIFQENPFMVSGALNVNALHFDSQITHAKKKIENGVSVLFTQPVLSARGFENLKRARAELPVKLLGGIMPVVSYRNATFMNNEMAGIEVCDEIICQYKEKNREEGEELAFQISARILDEIQDYVDGYYVITPFKRVDLILRLVEYIRSKER
ncbi:MAG: bifunctional homocysteine S-methyltransferase/methylenetetrahydrofolate reductase [Clostridiaceae bacterium]|nr:bifunctional homocysteine S-methyltransferase/methylenetetrahydrofolate reductase [Clostridiaceae bacterium]